MPSPRQDLKSLIAAAPAFQGPGFLLPTRNHEVFAWCPDSGLKLVMQMTGGCVAALDPIVTTHGFLCPQQVAEIWLTKAN
jgi:hypothetical protein